LPGADWSRPLPRPLTIPTVMKLSILADVRDLFNKHLPEQYRRKPTLAARLNNRSQDPQKERNENRLARPI
jgi:hypothetical protein